MGICTLTTYKGLENNHVQQEVYGLHRQYCLQLDVKYARTTFCVYAGSRLTDFLDQKSIDGYICVVLVHYMHGYCPLGVCLYTTHCSIVRIKFYK